MISNVDTMAFSADGKRKLWSEESMEAAKNGVQNENMTIREASKLYNVPFKTLRRRVNGTVGSGCKPGPATVLTKAEEEHLESYLIQMADMGFGLNRETVMCLAFKIVDTTQRKHPFKDQKAGHTWFDGFRRHHPKLSIRSPLPLSYCRAWCANMDTINDFFGKLGAIDLDDPSYTAWLKINHPTEVCSNTTKSSSLLVSGELLKESRNLADSGKSKLSSGDALSEIPALPRPVPRATRKRKPALNAKAVCITDDTDVEKAEAEKEKEAKKIERERKKKTREEKQLERERKKIVDEEKRLERECKKIV